VAPAGVKVGGELQSGDIRLAGVGAVDVTLTSGDVGVDSAAGAARVGTTSGDIVAGAVRGDVTLHTPSGNLEAGGVGGAADLQTTSGNIEAQLLTPAAVRAHADNGDVQVIVPDGTYRVRVSPDNGDQDVTVPDTPAAVHLVDVQTDNGDVIVRHG